jgi:TIR domain-containing protein
MPHRVFLSYSHVDRETAETLCARLEARGIGCWMAPRDIMPGADWGASIIDAIDGARVMVLVFSGASNQSRQVRREVERAVAKNVTIIPFKVEQVPLGKTLEYFLATTHWMDASTAPLEDHVVRLADGIQALLDAPDRDTTGAIEAMKMLSPPPLMPRQSPAPAPAPPPAQVLPAAKASIPRPTMIALGVAVVAVLFYVFVFGGGPELVAVDFPSVIPASGQDVAGSVQFKAGNNDVVGARFAVVEASSFVPFEVRAAAAGQKAGRIPFVIHASAAQRVTLEARLVDAAGRQSRPYRFTFEARKSGRAFQIEVPHFRVKVP